MRGGGRSMNEIESSQTRRKGSHKTLTGPTFWGKRKQLCEEGAGRPAIQDLGQEGFQGKSASKTPTCKKNPKEGCARANCKWQWRFKKRKKNKPTVRERKLGTSRGAGEKKSL